MRMCEFCEYVAEGVEWNIYRCPNCGQAIRWVYMPTQEEITEGCKDIRRKWTPREKESRLASAYRTVHADMTASTGVGVRRRGKSTD